jgi:hypothetical protein
VEMCVHQGVTPTGLGSEILWLDPAMSRHESSTESQVMLLICSLGLLCRLSLPMCVWMLRIRLYNWLVCQYHLGPWVWPYALPQSSVTSAERAPVLSQHDESS